MSIVPTVERLEVDHLDSAARLVAENAARSRFPLTDEGLQSAVRDALTRVDVADGVVARREGDVVGFLAGFRVPLFGGLPGVFVPEWCHATKDDPSLYGPLYRSASSRWVTEGRTTHAVTCFEGDSEARHAWFGLGFGKHLLDGVRRADAAAQEPRPVEVVSARAADVEVVSSLWHAMSAHLSSAPSFIDGSTPDRETLVTRLGDPQRPVFIAMRRGEAVGMVSLTTSEDAPLSVRRRVAVRIDGMYVDPGSRGRGVGSALVEVAVSWVTAQGLEWIAVDYETANLEAAAFWPTRGFDPVLVSLVRTIGSR